AKRTTAGVFKIYHAYFNQQQMLNDTIQVRKQQFQLRELILLQKINASQDTVETLRTVISLFGGNGAIEDFSSIPRLFRDAMVNELWEGPRNVLLTQIHRDIRRASKWYPPGEFVEDILAGCDQSLVGKFSEDIEQLITYDLATTPHQQSIQHAKDWERFCNDLFFAYQEQAFNEVGDAPIVKKFEFKKQLN